MTEAQRKENRRQAEALIEEAAKQQGADKWGVARLGGDHGYMASVQWLAEDAVLSLHLGRCDGYGPTPLHAVEECLRFLVTRRDKTRRGAQELAGRLTHQAELLGRRLETL